MKKEFTLLSGLLLVLLFCAHVYAMDICFYDGGGYFYHLDVDPSTGNITGYWEYPEGGGSGGALYGTYNPSSGGFTFACLSRYGCTFIDQGVFHGNGSEFYWENSCEASGKDKMFMCGHSMRQSIDPANMKKHQ
ncbi:MAG: hypothetical protein SV775_07445 [Thermodesulfobacteriota bacterium]|nr:hypothetical protein [Thermodesulfobacteriota bacterium]